MAVERPQYSVQISEKPFEVREYAPMIAAEVHAPGTREEAVNAGFRILAGYIFGDNLGRGKIAMTAPVTQSKAPGSGMTAPVEQLESQTGWDVRFSMPAAYTLATLPKPADPRIRLLEIPRRRVACVTFSGFWSDANLDSHQSRLAEFLKTHSLIAVSSPVYAYYDPPWTPWFWRTNEILVEVAPAAP
jgi:hypothetical protein